MTYDPMEPAALVALRLAPAVPGFARAELPEILRRPRHDVLEQLEGNTAERLTCGAGQPRGTELMCCPLANRPPSVRRYATSPSDTMDGAEKLLALTS